MRHKNSIKPSQNLNSNIKYLLIILGPMWSFPKIMISIFSLNNEIMDKKILIIRIITICEFQIWYYGGDERTPIKRFVFDSTSIILSGIYK